MSRFRWLEVSDKEERDKSRKEETPEERGFDEHHYVKLADEQLAEGLYEGALRYYSRALNINLKLEKAWTGQLLCLVDLGEYREAITWADKALEIFPGSADISALKALAWGRQGDMDKAEGFSDSSLKHGEQNSLAWWVRGDILLADNAKNAEFCFQKALEADRKNWMLLLRIGKSFMSVGRSVEAKEFFVRARNLEQRNPLVWYWLGVSYKEMGMVDEATDCFQKAAGLRPGNPVYRTAVEDVKKMGLFSRLARRVKALVK
jgi:tetratricopeptide (TPR) repeat protein